MTLREEMSALRQEMAALRSSIDEHAQTLRRSESVLGVVVGSYCEFCGKTKHYPEQCKTPSLIVQGAESAHIAEYEAQLAEDRADLLSERLGDARAAVIKSGNEGSSRLGPREEGALAAERRRVSDLEIDLEARSKQLAVAKHRSGRYRALAHRCLDKLEERDD